MKATLTYECNEQDHEQMATVTVEGDFDKPGAMIDAEMEFDPECSDDTSDPTGLLHCLIEAFQNFAARAIERK